MKSKSSILAMLMVMLFVLSSLASAQPRFGRRRATRVKIRQVSTKEMLGIRVGNDFDSEEHLIGAQLVLPAGIFWRLVPSFEYYFVNENAKYDRWQFNTDLIFKPRPFGLIYFGGGLAVDYKTPENAESITNFGGNALVGLEFQRARSPIGLYVQARWSFFDETYFSVLGGLNFALR